MEDQYQFTSSEEERAARRAARIQARRLRQRARRRRLLLRSLLPAAALLAAFLWLAGQRAPAAEPEEQPMTARAAEEDPPPPAAEPEERFSPQETASTVRLGEEVSSGYAVLIDLDSGTVLAEKDSHTAVSPASMTKILTILVAAEQIGDLNDTAPVTQEITDFCFSNDYSVAGFLPGEAVPLGELFYGAILPSGADASLALANYVAGSQEAFVELMNRKAAELGLSESARFSNCVGLYSEDNVCPVYDMALILKAAMDNDLCRQVLTQKTFDIPPSEAHPEGLPLSNWFIRRIEDHMPEGVELLGAKTGFINESGNCAASMAQDASGRRFICVTAQAGGVWQCIYDHVALYGMA